MTLFEKIIAFYPKLTVEDFDLVNGTITLQDDSDDKGPYITKWEHPTLKQPTQAQLDGVTK